MFDALKSAKRQYTKVRNYFGGCPCKNQVLVLKVFEVLSQFEDLVKDYLYLATELKLDHRTALEVKDRNDLPSILFNVLKNWVIASSDGSPKIKKLSDALKRSYLPIVNALHYNQLKDDTVVVICHEHKDGCESKTVADAAAVQNFQNNPSCSVPSKVDDEISQLFNLQAKMIGFSKQDTLVFQNLQNLGKEGDLFQAINLLKRYACTVEKVRRVRPRRKNCRNGSHPDTLKPATYPLLVQWKPKKSKEPIRAPFIASKLRRRKRLQENKIAVEEFDEDDYSDLEDGVEDESDSDNEMIEQGVDAAAMPDRVEFVQENGSYSFQAQSMQKGPSPTPQGNGSYQGQQHNSGYTFSSQWTPPANKTTFDNYPQNYRYGFGPFP